MYKEIKAVLLVMAAPLLFMLPQSVWSAVEDIAEVHDIIKHMTVANRQLDYSGIFTYEHAGVLKTIKVAHAVSGAGVETEKLEHLSGPARGFIRQGHSRKCEYGDAFHNYYDFYLRGKDRVAGRQVRVVHLVPKDEHRYGYVLGVDKKTGLLLQSMLVGSNRRVLERFQFVQVELHAKDKYEQAQADVSAGKEPLEGERAPKEENDSAIADCPEIPVLQKSSRWRLDWLPPGFSLAGFQNGPEHADQNTAFTDAETMLYSDGLNQFSVFIDDLNLEDLPQIQAQRGATVAHLTRIKLSGQSYSVSVVGEIPPKTAQLVAESVSLAQPLSSQSSQ